MNEIMTSEKDGFIFQSFGKEGLVNGNMEGIQGRLKRCLTGDVVYVDLGAHIGSMSIPVIKATNPKRSILVEANPQVIPLLTANCRVNLEGYDVSIVNKAVCDKNEEVDFYVVQEKQDSSSLARTDLMTIQPTRVQGVTLDVLLDGIEEDIVMKVDIEAAELLMWKGMNVVRPKIKHMVLEWFPNAMQEGWAAELLARIHESKFLIKLFNGNGVTDEQLMEIGKHDLWLQSAL